MSLVTIFRRRVEERSALAGRPAYGSESLALETTAEVVAEDLQPKANRQSCETG